MSQRLMIFGGSDQAQNYSDVWAAPLTGTGPWTEILPAGSSPGERSGHSTIFDPVRRRLIIFGGYASRWHGVPPRTFSNDVWALSLDGVPTWTEITPSGTLPPRREDHAAIYDPVRDRMIILGGSDSQTRFGDMWALSLSGEPRWTRLPVGFTQPHPEAIYDPVRDRMVLFAENATRTANEVWVQNLSQGLSWDRLPDGPSPIPYRLGAAVLYDPYGDRMIVVGPSGASGVWSYPFGTSAGWQDVTPGVTPNKGTAAVHDPVGRRLILTTAETRDIWALPLDPIGPWTAVLVHPAEPAFRWGHVAVFDDLTKRMIVYGGNRSDGALWSLSVEGDPLWTPLVAMGDPGLRESFVGVLDTRRRRLIVHGGKGSPEMGTWALPLDGPLAWTRIDDPGSNPRDWISHVGIYDPLRDRLLVFGGMEGECDHTCDYEYLREVWALNLEGPPVWTLLPVEGEPPPHLVGAEAIYDPRRDRFVVHGGRAYTYPEYPGRTWALELSNAPTWTVLAEASDPLLDVGDHAAIYDPARDRMVIYFGNKPEAGSTGTWALSLSGSPAWRELHPVNSPGMRRREHTAVYDAHGDRMIVYSGYITPTTWSLGWQDDEPVSALIGAASPVVDGNSVSLQWSVSPNISRATLFRREDDTDWIALAEPELDGRSIVTYVDRSVRAGHRYGYGLGLDEQSEIMGVVWAEIPAPNGIALRLRENPVRGPLAMTVQLGVPGAARLELFDVTGRRLAHRDLGVLDAGLHDVQWGEVSRHPGLHFLRLTQGARSETVRALRLP